MKEGLLVFFFGCFLKWYAKNFLIVDEKKTESAQRRRESFEYEIFDGSLKSETLESSCFSFICCKKRINTATSIFDIALSSENSDLLLSVIFDNICSVLCWFKFFVDEKLFTQRTFFCLAQNYSKKYLGIIFFLIIILLSETLTHP